MRTARLQANDDVRELSRAEHLVLLGFRSVALGCADCPILHRTYQCLLGAEAEGALCNLVIFVRLLASAGQRRVLLHPPGCCRVSADERMVLEVVAAAQASLAGRGEADLRDAMSTLLARPPSEAALMATQTFAAAFMLSDLDLRIDAPPARAATLH